MEAALDAAIAAFEPNLPLAVGFSGGADSTALLLACSQKWPGQISAVHINHGLQAAAGEFEQHCLETCRVHDIPLKVIAVQAKALPGQSPEAVARDARYKGFAHFVEENQRSLDIKNIALAHHEDDQIETFLIALSRGAGLAGLSAMPHLLTRGGIQYWRPLLQVSATEIRRWLHHRQIRFIEDPTNTDLRFLRNRIRHQILPSFKETFPHFAQPFARSLLHIVQAQELLDEMAAADLATVMPTAPGPRIRQLQALSGNRQGNVLRYWLGTCCSAIPSAAQLGELLSQVAHCKTRGHHVEIKVAGGKVVREGECLTWYNP